MHRKARRPEGSGAHAADPASPTKDGIVLPATVDPLASSSALDLGAVDVLERRAFLTGGAALGMGALALAGFGSAPAALLFDKTRAGGIGPSCILTPEQLPGPNWRPVIVERRDVTEGRPGMPLAIFLRVVSLATCQPIPGLILDFWQADHAGVYSAIAAQGTTGQTFLRGFQTTNANGMVRFDTIYPGWYPGRTTHLHIKAFQGVNVVFDTQLYLPEAVTELVYTTGVYAPRGQKDTSNVNDPLYVPETVMPTRVMRSATLGQTVNGEPIRLYTGMTLVLDL